jgi:hypothetical protein
VPGPAERILRLPAVAMSGECLGEAGPRQPLLSPASSVPSGASSTSSLPSRCAEATSQCGNSREASRTARTIRASVIRTASDLCTAKADEQPQQRAYPGPAEREPRLRDRRHQLHETPERHPPQPHHPVREQRDQRAGHRAAHRADQREKQRRLREHRLVPGRCDQLLVQPHVHPPSSCAPPDECGAEYLTPSLTDGLRGPPLLSPRAAPYGRHRTLCSARCDSTAWFASQPSTEPVQLGTLVKFPDGWEANHAVLSHLAEHRVRWQS